MIWQKIDYIHANPVKAGLGRSPRTTYGPVFDRFTHKVMPLWLWTMSGGGRKIPKSCPRR